MKYASGTKCFMVIVMAATLAFSSCTSLQYIRDQESYERQKKLHGNRAGRAALESGLTVGSVILSAVTGAGIAYMPQGNRLKKVALVNESPDTLVINMLTDISWKKDSFCDFLQIEIPPSKKCRLLVPYGAVYNVYFSQTPEVPSDDEMIELNTLTTRKLQLKPGMTDVIANDSTLSIIN